MKRRTEKHIKVIMRGRLKKKERDSKSDIEKS